MSLDQALIILCGMCIIVAGALAWFKKDGWLWFVLLAILTILNGKNW